MVVICLYWQCAHHSVWLQMMQFDAAGWHWIYLNPRDISGVQSKVEGLEITRFRKCLDLCQLHILWWKWSHCQTMHGDSCSTTSHSQQSWCLKSQVLEWGHTNWDNLGELCQCTGRQFIKAVTWNNDNGYIPHHPCFWGVGVLHRLWRCTPGHCAPLPHCGNLRSVWFAQRWF